MVESEFIAFIEYEVLCAVTFYKHGFCPFEL